MNFQKSILILKPGIELNADASEHDLESDAVELFKRDAWMHICKCKHHENRNHTNLLSFFDFRSTKF